MNDDDDDEDAVILPLYKCKDDKSECNNYRGMSLLSVVEKMYSRMKNN